MLWKWCDNKVTKILWQFTLRLLQYKYIENDSINITTLNADIFAPQITLQSDSSHDTPLVSYCVTNHVVMSRVSSYINVA